MGPIGPSKSDIWMMAIMMICVGVVIGYFI